MADATVTELRPSPAMGEVTRKPKDPTAALRARRARRKRKAAAVTATIAKMETPKGGKLNEIRASVTPSRSTHRGVTICATVAALSLATVSAGFSITGLTSIFVGAFWPVIGMGAALELGKLSAVAWLGRAGCAVHPARPLKIAVGMLIGVLMALNAIGAYGFLARAHIAQELVGSLNVASRTADVEARTTLQAGIVADIDRRIAQIDSAVEKSVDRGRSAAAMRLADEQRKARADLAGKRITEAKTLAGLLVEKATIEGERAKVAADLGPVRYLATLLGAGDQDVMRWFILVVALLLDPAAVLLLLAAASARR
jgi:hypothetical protein